MRKCIVGCIIMLQFLASRLDAQLSYTDRANNYVIQFSGLAVSEQVKSGIPAAIILAQGILETEAGASELATQANNHFGIKCKSDWRGQTFTHTDDLPNECFRKYNSAEESYRDHSIYLASTPRYAALFKLPQTDYKAWASGLKRCGYATSPTYAQRLVKIIEDFSLQDYTYIAINKKLELGASPNEALATNAPVNTKSIVTEQKGERNADAPHTNQTFGDGEEMTVNGLRAIYAFKGQTLLKYAIKYKIRYERLLEMNDLPDAPLPYNMYVYLEKKKYRGTRPTHVVKPGETLLQISQLEGIQLRRLMQLNYVAKMGDEPIAGTVLELQNMADKKPVFAEKEYVAKSTINKPGNQNNTTASTSTYIYKSTTTTTTSTYEYKSTTTTGAANNTQQGTTNQKAAVYDQYGNKIIPKEQNKEIQRQTVIDPPHIIKPPVYATAPIVATPKPPVSTRPMMNTKVTEIVVDKGQNKVTTATQSNTTPSKTSDYGIIADEKPTVVTTNTTAPNNKPDTTVIVKRQVTEQKIITENNEDQKDPLVQLKAQLDKVVYKDSKPPRNTTTATKVIPKDQPEVTQTTSATDSGITKESRTTIRKIQTPTKITANATITPTEQKQVVSPVVNTGKNTVTTTVQNKEEEKLTDKPIALNTEATQGKEDPEYHTVKKGETAYLIARRHNITLRQLMDWNNLDFDDVKEGQKLRVKK